MPLRLWTLEGEKGNNEPVEMENFLSSLSEEQRYVFEERAAIMEYDGGLTREEAEKQAQQLLQRRK
jgi:hypothetical protein